jgi:protein-S-isoprenylcysteine O-methyltransferase Ste14
MNPTTLGKLYVAQQFGLLLALAALCAVHLRGALPGVATWLLWLASGVLGLWTLSVNRLGNFNIHPEPRSDGRLVKDGPYQWVRHPMYSAVLLLAAGCSVWLASTAGWVLFAALFAVLIGKASLEEQWLLQRYPGYADYRQRTKRFIRGVY